MPSNRATIMLRVLHWLSSLFTGAGVCMIAGVVVLDLGASWLLAGVFLLWAGIVKLIVLRLWTRLVGLGTDRHEPIRPL